MLEVWIEHPIDITSTQQVQILLPSDFDLPFLSSYLLSANDEPCSVGRGHRESKHPITTSKTCKVNTSKYGIVQNSYMYLKTQCMYDYGMECLSSSLQQRWMMWWDWPSMLHSCGLFFCLLLWKKILQSRTKICYHFIIQNRNHMVFWCQPADEVLKKKNY